MEITLKHSNTLLKSELTLGFNEETQSLFIHVKVIPDEWPYWVNRIKSLKDDKEMNAAIDQLFTVEPYVINCPATIPSHSDEFIVKVLSHISETAEDKIIMCIKHVKGGIHES